MYLLQREEGLRARESGAQPSRRRKGKLRFGRRTKRESSDRGRPEADTKIRPEWKETVMEGAHMWQVQPRRHRYGKSGL